MVESGRKRCKGQKNGRLAHRALISRKKFWVIATSIFACGQRRQDAESTPLSFRLGLHSAAAGQSEIATMEDRPHPYVRTLIEQENEGTISRRDFLRDAASRAVSAAASYSFVGMVEPSRTSKAQSVPMGGNLRIRIRYMQIKHPH